MDQRRFDSLARSLAAPKTRRGFVGILAAVAAGLAARGADAQVTQAQCGNQVCASNPGGCKPGCVCCVYTNAVTGTVTNSRCRPPGTCSPGTQVGGTTTTPTTTTTTTTAAPTTTTTQAPPLTCTSPGDCAAGSICCAGACVDPATCNTCDPDCVSDLCVNRACVEGVCQETPPLIIISFPCNETVCDPVQGYSPGAPKVCNTPGPGETGPGQCVVPGGCVYPNSCAVCQTFVDGVCVDNCPPDTFSSCTDGQPGICNRDTGFCQYTSVCGQCETCGFSATCETVPDGTIWEIPIQPGFIERFTCCGGARSTRSCNLGICGTSLPNGATCCGTVFDGDKCCQPPSTVQGGICCATQVVDGVCCSIGEVNVDGHCCPAGKPYFCDGVEAECCDHECTCNQLGCFCT